MGLKKNITSAFKVKNGVLLSESGDNTLNLPVFNFFASNEHAVRFDELTGKVLKIHNNGIVLSSFVTDRVLYKNARLEESATSAGINGIDRLKKLKFGADDFSLILKYKDGANYTNEYSFIVGDVNDKATASYYTQHNTSIQFGYFDSSNTEYTFDICPNSENAELVIFIVKSGDTLLTIAQSNNTVIVHKYINAGLLNAMRDLSNKVQLGGAREGSEFELCRVFDSAILDVAQYSEGQEIEQIVINADIASPPYSSYKALLDLQSDYKVQADASEDVEKWSGGDNIVFSKYDEAGYNTPDFDSINNIVEFDALNNENLQYYDDDTLLFKNDNFSFIVDVELTKIDEILYFMRKSRSDSSSAGPSQRTYYIAYTLQYNPPNNFRFRSHYNATNTEISVSTTAEVQLTPFLGERLKIVCGIKDKRLYICINNVFAKSPSSYSNINDNFIKHIVLGMSNVLTATFPDPAFSSFKCRKLQYYPVSLINPDDYNNDDTVNVSTKVTKSVYIDSSLRDNITHDGKDITSYRNAHKYSDVINMSGLELKNYSIHDDGTNASITLTNTFTIEQSYTLQLFHQFTGAWGTGKKIKLGFADGGTGEVLNLGFEIETTGTNQYQITVYRSIVLSSSTSMYTYDTSKGIYIALTVKNGGEWVLYVNGVVALTGSDFVNSDQSVNRLFYGSATGEGIAHDFDRVLVTHDLLYVKPNDKILGQKVFISK